MISLPVFNPTQRHREFGTALRPLRPSRLVEITRCPMQAYMASVNDDDGNEPAQTGNLVHTAAATYHRNKGSPDERREAGIDALRQARDKFPKGDPEKAITIFSRYAADPKNQTATLLWVEEHVRLELKAAPDDPTGEPIVIEGTLDQVRLYDGVKQVWDIKTGSGKSADETILEYSTQQAAYVLAARETLDPTIEPGGIIYTPGYEKPRGRKFLPLQLSIEDCEWLMIPVIARTADIRRGDPQFTPSVDACRYCDFKPYPRCQHMYRGVYS